MDFIKFMGTGGGRFVLITQLRATGGIYIEMDDTRLYIDPGPGALVHATRHNLPLRKLNALLVSHAHIDHCNDANVMIEAMTNGITKKRGVLIGNVSAIEGYENNGKRVERITTDYHLNALEKYFVVNAGDEVEVGNVKIAATKALHTDPKAVGFRIESDKYVIGYTGDTIYFDNIGSQFKGCDVLILNCLFNQNPYKGQDVEFSKHMDSEDALEIIRHAKPKLAVLQHFGMEMLRSMPWEVAKRITEETGVKTIAARDFQEIKLKDVVEGSEGKDEQHRKSLADWS